MNKKQTDTVKVLTEVVYYRTNNLPTNNGNNTEIRKSIKERNFHVVLSRMHSARRSSVDEAYNQR